MSDYPTIDRVIADLGRLSASRAAGGEVMPCPICDQKPMNCDCTETERRMYSEAEDLENEITRLRMLIQNAAYLLQGSPVGSGCYEAWQVLTEAK